MSVLLLFLFAGLVAACMTPGDIDKGVADVSFVARGHETVLFRDVRHAAWSPDDSSLLVTIDYGGNQELDLIASDGTFLRPIVRSSGYEGVAHWSAVRDEILFQTDRDAEGGPAFSLYSIRPDGTQLSRLVTIDQAVMFGRWSPDGRHVVFNDVAGPKPRQIQLYDVESGNVKPLTQSDSFHHDYGSWSPDGQWILFESTRDGAWDTYRMRADGSEIVRVGLQGSSAPRYSPDGSAIAFHEIRNGLDYDIFLADADGSGVRLLAGGAGDQRLPEWSPDGQSIAYISNEAGHHDLFTIRPDGSRKSQLTHQPRGEFFSVLKTQGREAAVDMFEEHRTSSSELKVFRDERVLELAFHQARRANNVHLAEALLEIGLTAFPESEILLALHDSDFIKSYDF